MQTEMSSGLAAVALAPGVPRTLPGGRPFCKRGSLYRRDDFSIGQTDLFRISLGARHGQLTSYPKHVSRDVRLWHVH